MPDRDRLYRLWPARRRALVDHDGRKVALPIFIVDAIVIALFWWPPVERATGIPPLASTALVLAHAVCALVEGFPLHSLARRKPWGQDLLQSFTMLYTVVICLGFICATHDPKTLLWSMLMIVAATWGSMQEVEPSWACLGTFVGAPLLTIPWFAAAAPGSWALAGPALMSCLCGAMYHVLALHQSNWRAERRRLQQRLQELERAQFTRDLHDGVGSTLALVGLCGHLLEQKLSAPEEARPLLESLQRATRDGLSELKAILNAAATSEGAPTAEAFCESLSRLAASTEALCGKVVRVELEAGGEHDLTAPARLALTRIFQEAVANALKHGRAANVVARMRASHEAIALEICDDGCGFDAAQAPRGRGLDSMGARARELGGTWEIESAPGRGTRICVRLPSS